MSIVQTVCQLPVFLEYVVIVRGYRNEGFYPIFVIAITDSKVAKIHHNVNPIHTIMGEKMR